MLKILFSVLILTSFGGTDAFAYEPVAKQGSYANKRAKASQTMVQERQEAKIKEQRALQQRELKKSVETYFNSPQYKNASEQAAEYLDGYVEALEDAYDAPPKQAPQPQPMARMKTKENKKGILNKYRSSSGNRYGFSKE